MVGAWSEVNDSRADRCRRMFRELEEAGSPDLARLSVALQEPRDLAYTGIWGQTELHALSVASER